MRWDHRLKSARNRAVQAVTAQAFIGSTCIGCSAAAPPATPMVSNVDAGHSSAAAGASSSAADPVIKQGLPLWPVASAWSNVIRPSPASVQMARPGGDAPDPNAAALVRLLEEPLGALRDKDNQVVVHYPDSRNWKRVRFRTFDHVVGFRYGDTFEATTVVLAIDTRAGRKSDSRACIRQVETLARPRLRALSVTIGPVSETEITWRDQRVIVHSVDGVLPWGFHRIEFSAAWVAYAAYDKACLVHGIGIKHDQRVDLAHLVRDRWILEVASDLEALTTTKPYRH